MIVILSFLLSLFFCSFVTSVDSKVAKAVESKRSGVIFPQYGAYGTTELIVAIQSAQQGTVVSSQKIKEILETYRFASGTLKAALIQHMQVAGVYGDHEFSKIAFYLRRACLEYPNKPCDAQVIAAILRAYIDANGVVSHKYSQERINAFASYWVETVNSFLKKPMPQESEDYKKICTVLMSFTWMVDSKTPSYDTCKQAFATTGFAHTLDLLLQQGLGDASLSIVDSPLFHLFLKSSPENKYKLFPIVVMLSRLYGDIYFSTTKKIIDVEIEYIMLNIVDRFKNGEHINHIIYELKKSSDPVFKSRYTKIIAALEELSKAQGFM